MGNASKPRIDNKYLRALIVAPLICSLSSCGNILDVSIPGDVTEEDLLEASMAPVLVNSAVTDFECAFSDAMLSIGLWSGQLMDASTWGSLAAQQLRFPTADAGNGTCAEQVFRGDGTTSPYRMLQIARSQARRAVDIIQGHTDLAGQAGMLATASAYEGYATMLLGEFYCEMRLDPDGPVLQPSEVLQLAGDRFEAARQFAQAAGNDQILNLARVGGARVAARLGELGEAQALAVAVPEGYAHFATMASTPVRRYNWVHTYNWLNLMVTVDPDYRDLTVDGQPDPRVPVVRRPDLAANDGSTEIWLAASFPTTGSPIPMATWQEAQLIIAQAALENGSGPEAVAAINRVRDHYDLAHYAGDGGLAAIREQLIEERRRQFFLQSHRLGDMLQFDLPFKVGIDHRNRAYSAEKCIPLPLAEA